MCVYTPVYTIEKSNKKDLGTYPNFFLYCNCSTKLRLPVVDFKQLTKQPSATHSLKSVGKQKLVWLSAMVLCLDSCPPARRSWMCSEAEFFPCKSYICFLFWKTLSFLACSCWFCRTFGTPDSKLPPKSLFTFFHTFPRGKEALRCWTAHVYVLNLPKWGRIKWLWLC